MLQYQLRFTLDMAGYMPAEVITLLQVYNAIPMCQYDLFAGYCREAEQEGVEDYPLYNWTIDTITNPEKKEKYQGSQVELLNQQKSNLLCQLKK